MSFGNTNMRRNMRLYRKKESPYQLVRAFLIVNFRWMDYSPKP
jgi:hypothetical protein